MDTKTLSDFIAWSKTTDLKHVVYKKDGTAVEIKTSQAAPEASDFSTPLTLVKSPAVGIYHSGIKGKALNIKENMKVNKNDLLGLVEMNKTSKEVTAPVGGTLKIICVCDGQPAEFGQPLFFIEP